MRLDKYLSHNGFGSRKEVRGFIKRKMVMVNGNTVRDHGYIVDLDNDEVRINNEIISYTKEAYFMLNKPKGYISSHETDDYPSVLELVDPFRPDLIIVGRLDVDTEGLLLITNDGLFAHNVAHGKKEIYKKYYVELLKTFDLSFIEELEEGIPLDERMLKPAHVEVINENSIYLSIAEGKYHQVKRMMHYCNNEVTYLKRVQIGTLELDETLGLGEFRELSAREIETLNK